MKLRLFTANYPYGFGESFINNELSVLKEEFEQINIYPRFAKEERQEAFKLIDLPLKIPKTEGYNINLTDKLFALKILFTEILLSKRRGYIMRSFRLLLSQFAEAIRLSKWIEDQEMERSDVFYSFWMNDWALALAILKSRGKIDHFVFRVNGFDIYNDRNPGNYLPYRHFIYRHTTKVYSVSKKATDYLKALNIHSTKVETAHFGTLDRGVIEGNNDVFTVLSNSTVIDLKRIDKIAKVMCLVKHQIRWIHHGDGPNKTKVLKILESAPSNLEWEFQNMMENYEDVITSIKGYRPNLFINLSTSEGLPVTMLEVLSLGIPILANDVGSCSEAVTKDTGILVDLNASEEEIAGLIDNMIKDPTMLPDRNQVRLFWEEEFKADINYLKFAEDLKRVFNLKH